MMTTWAAICIALVKNEFTAQRRNEGALHTPHFKMKTLIQMSIDQWNEFQKYRFTTAFPWATKNEVKIIKILFQNFAQECKKQENMQNLETEAQWVLKQVLV